MLTVEEREFRAKTTASLRAIEKQLERIADALTQWVGKSQEPINNDNKQ